MAESTLEGATTDRWWVDSCDSCDSKLQRTLDVMHSSFSSLVQQLTRMYTGIVVFHPRRVTFAFAGALRLRASRISGGVYGIPRAVLPLLASKLLWRIYRASENPSGAVGERARSGRKPRLARPKSSGDDGLPPFLLPVRDHSQPWHSHHAEASQDDARGGVEANSEGISPDYFAVVRPSRVALRYRRGRSGLLAGVWCGFDIRRARGCLQRVGRRPKWFGRKGAKFVIVKGII